MRWFLKALLSIVTTGIMVWGFAIGYGATKPLDADLAVAREERARLAEENRRLRSEREALQQDLIAYAMQEITASRVGSRGMTIYLANEGDHAPAIYASGESRLRNAGTP